MNMALARPVLDALAEAVNELRAGRQRRTQIVVGGGEVVASRALRVCVGVREHDVQVHHVRVRPMHVVEARQGEGWHAR